MSVTLTYKVHSVADDPIEVVADYNGQPVKAYVPGLVVELTDEQNNHGHIYRFLPDDSNFGEHRALFQRGQTVTLTFSKE